MRPPLGLRPPGGLMRAPQVADYCAAAWPVFTPPLTVVLPEFQNKSYGFAVSDEAKLLRNGIKSFVRYSEPNKHDAIIFKASMNQKAFE